MNIKTSNRMARITIYTLLLTVIILTAYIIQIQKENTYYIKSKLATVNKLLMVSYSMGFYDSSLCYTDLANHLYKHKPELRFYYKPDRVQIIMKNNSLLILYRKKTTNLKENPFVPYKFPSEKKKENNLSGKKEDNTL